MMMIKQANNEKDSKLCKNKSSSPLLSPHPASRPRPYPLQRATPVVTGVILQRVRALPRRPPVPGGQRQRQRRRGGPGVHVTGPAPPVPAQPAPGPPRQVPRPPPRPAKSPGTPRAASGRRAPRSGPPWPARRSDGGGGFQGLRLGAAANSHLPAPGLAPAERAPTHLRGLGRRYRPAQTPGPALGRPAQTRGSRVLPRPKA